LDNHYTEKDAKKGTRNAVLSSIMIQETFGGAHKLCQDLLTDQRGGFVVNPDEIKERKEIYGQNSFPPPKIKTIK